MKLFAKDKGASHTLTIKSLHDVKLECTCSWSLAFTGMMTAAEAKREFEKHCYQDFAFHWQKEHAISKPPSFTSWRQSYRGV